MNRHKAEWKNARLLGAGIACLFVSIACSSNASAEEINLLGAGSEWKKKHVLFPFKVSEKAAKVAGLPTEPASRAKLLEKSRKMGRSTFKWGKFTPEKPPQNWMQKDFDDGDWLSAKGMEFDKGGYGINPHWSLVVARASNDYIPEIGLIAMRGRFVIKDAAKVKNLSLNLTYRGGFVVYLNGEELARRSMPEGKIEHDTPSDDYPIEAFLIEDNGKTRPHDWYRHRDPKFHTNWQKRERKSGDIAIDSKKLVDGVNVIALELHRADYPVVGKSKKGYIGFATVGLSEFFLKAQTPRDNVITACDRPEAFQVRNADTWQAVTDTHMGNPAQELRPIQIAAAMNGSFSGQVIVSSTKAIENLKVTASTLTGSAGTIEADRVTVRYGALNPTRGAGFSWFTGLKSQRFDLLLDTAPAKVDVRKTSAPPKYQNKFRNALGLPVEPRPAAIIPVWLTVEVPADTSAGLYKGAISISAVGQEPTRVPVEVNVSDWRLPDVKDYTPPYFIYQSPESLAECYGVTKWSEEHWRLIERSLKLLGEFGNGGIILTLMAQTCMGNSEGMVIWEAQEDGSYKHDYTVLDRYLKTAMKYQIPERLKVVGLYVWGYELLQKPKINPRAPLWNNQLGRITVRGLDGRKTNAILPRYGTPEAEAIWRPVLQAIKKKLEAYNAADKLMLGMGGDSSANPRQMKMLMKILPGTPWWRESHFDKVSLPADGDDRTKTVPVGCNSIVWGGAIPNPDKKRLYGWKYNPRHIILNFNRPGTICVALNGFPSPWKYRMWMESTITCGRNGNGRVGGDFFKFGKEIVLKEWKGKKRGSTHVGGSGGTLFGRYPDSSVGQIGLGNSTTDLLGPGKEGPVTTVRFENARMGNQEAEARIFIEKAILAKAIPADLAERCQAHLDKRANALRMNMLTRNGNDLGSIAWRRSARQLYDLAGEVAKAMK